MYAYFEWMHRPWGSAQGSPYDHTAVFTGLLYAERDGDGEGERCVETGRGAR